MHNERIVLIELVRYFGLHAFNKSKLQYPSCYHRHYWTSEVTILVASLELQVVLK